MPAPAEGPHQEEPARLAQFTNLRMLWNCFKFLQQDP
jgi:hypothetical protein